VLALTIATGILTPIIDAIWHLRAESGWPSKIPEQDLKLLDHIAQTVPITARVLQFPEPPLLAGGGRDQWVAIIAGRIVPASLRATNWHDAAPIWAVTQRFYSGQSATVPNEADYIYFSRVLHPKTYDALVRRMAGERDWMRDYCLPDACLFKRTLKTGSR
jgi:hypothetical protein